ncbi:MAG: hypothetical protein IPI49_10260 [Myxococcales bacterium]|jgi:hypothetical protein|nr:hypothetical protein [Myxococcales bacterium]HRC55710.1 hypothetical protein [Kofleriaceae bacterium]
MTEQASYQQYLERWEKDVGPAEVGAFAKFSGRLIKKLSAEEFDPVIREYEALAQRYFDSVERGDTVNDVVVRLLRERAANLLLAAPV